MNQPPARAPIRMTALATTSKVLSNRRILSTSLKDLATSRRPTSGPWQVGAAVALTLEGSAFAVLVWQTGSTPTYSRSPLTSVVYQASWRRRAAFQAALLRGSILSWLPFEEYRT